MIYRIYVTLLLVLLLQSCSSLPNASEDNVVLTSSIKTTKQGRWANIHAQDFAQWRVPFVKEYGYIPEDRYIYSDKNYKHTQAASPLGVKTLTSSRNASPKVAIGQLAGKIEYWLGREVMNAFAYKTHDTKTFTPTYKSDPSLSGEAFYFKNTPAKDTVRFMMALVKSGIPRENVMTILRNCSNVSGWKTLTHLDPNYPKKYPLLAGIKKRSVDTNNFHQACFKKIIDFSPYTVKYGEKTLKTLPPMFKNSKYMHGGQFFASQGDDLIKQVIDYDEFNGGYYDAGFLAHLKGKYGMDIREKLRHNSARMKEYNSDDLRVMVHLSDSSLLLSHPQQANEEYFYMTHDQMNFTSHILSKVFKKKTPKHLYQDFHSMVSAATGSTQYGQYIFGQNVLKPFKGKCNFAPGTVQLAHKWVSRFEMDCIHAPIKTGNTDIDNQEYVNYQSTPSVLNANENLLTSRVKIFSMNEADKILGEVRTPGVNSMSIEFNFNRDFADMMGNHKNAKFLGGLKDGKVDALQPDSSHLTNIAMTLAKNFPPSAVIVWAPPYSDEAYAFHHGVLWKFPIKELRSRRNEPKWRELNNITDI